MQSSLALPDGRTLAYAYHGDPQSGTVILYLHGMFSYGKIDPGSQAPALSVKHVFQISPSLPGWGRSSPAPSGITYPKLLASDMTSLLDCAHPTPITRLFIAGGSFGTFPAQVLYGAPYDIFPYGRQVAGMLLMGPFSPFRDHVGYAKSFTWANYIGVGPPSRYLPFLPYLLKIALSRKFSTVEGAKGLISGMLYHGMDDAERQVFDKWRIRKGKMEGQLETDLAKDLVKSVDYSWAGFMESASLLHTDWGFKIQELDDEHNKAPVLIVAGDNDKSATMNMAEFLHENYRNSTLKVLHGGHLSALVYMDEIWEEFLGDV